MNIYECKVIHHYFNTTLDLLIVKKNVSDVIAFILKNYSVKRGSYIVSAEILSIVKIGEDATGKEC